MIQPHSDSFFAQTAAEIGREMVERETAVSPRKAPAKVQDIRPNNPTGPRTFETLPGGGYVLALPDDGIRVEFRLLRREHHLLHAEVDVQCNWGGALTRNGHLACSDLNLSSQTARVQRAKYCGDRAKTPAGLFDWVGVIDDACCRVIQAERGGSNVVVLDDAPDVADLNHEVLGLEVPADASSLLIAHGDSLKSMVLLTVLGTLARRGHRALFIDYEWTAARHKARKRRLFGLDRLENLRYIRCHAPLTVEADGIRRYCEEHQVEIIGVDSVGMACDGKLADDDTAIRFHRALATLPPAICAAHVPKSSLGLDGKGDAIGPFGSVFFSNLCRASWLVKKQANTAGNIVHVGLFPQKQNDGDRTRPVGLEYTFTPDAIRVRSANLADVDGLADRLPLPGRIAHLLTSGPKTYAGIAEELNAKLDTVIKAANRGHAFTKVSGKDGITRIALVERQRAD